MTYTKTVESPKIKGLHLGLSYNEAVNVVGDFPLTPDNLSPTPGVELAHGVKSNYNDLRAFSFTNHAVKDLYNVNRIE